MSKKSIEDTKMSKTTEMLNLINELYKKQAPAAFCKEQTKDSIYIAYDEEGTDHEYLTQEQLYKAILNWDVNTIEGLVGTTFLHRYALEMFTPNNGRVIKNGRFTKNKATNGMPGVNGNNLSTIGLLATSAFRAQSDLNNGRMRVPVNSKGELIPEDAYTLLLEGDLGLFNRIGGPKFYEKVNTYLPKTQTEKQALEILGIEENIFKGKALNAIAKEIKEVLNEWGATPEKWFEHKKPIALVELITAGAYHIAVRDYPELNWYIPNKGQGGLISNEIVRKELTAEEIKEYRKTRPANAYMATEPDFVWFDREFSKKDLLFVAELFHAAFPQQFRVEKTQQGFNMFFEKDKVVIDDLGIHDHRKRHVQQVLIATGDACCQKYYLVNNYGTMILFMLEGLSYLQDNFNGTYPIGQWYRKFIRELPMDTEYESGGVDAGERKQFNDSIAVLHDYTGLLLWEHYKHKDLKRARCIKKLIGVMPGLTQLSKLKGAKSKVAAAAIALRKYNLVQIHKGSMSFFANSLVAMRLKDLESNNALAISFLVDCCKQASGLTDEVEAVRAAFKIKPVSNRFAPYKTKEDFFKAVLGHGVLGFSTKISKITKRVTLSKPKHAEPIDGTLRCLASLDQGLYERAPGHRYTAAYFPNMIYAPGMSILLGKLKNFKVKTSTNNVIEAYDENDWNVLNNLYTATKDPVHKEWVYTVGEEGKAVKAGETIVEFGFINSKQERMVNTVVAEQDCHINEVRIRINNFGSAEVRVKYYTLQHRVKIRQNFKCMIAGNLEGKRVMYNQLNENLIKGIDIIIPGDGDKSKDLLMWLVDVFAETAVANGQGHELAKLNELFGGADDHLVWCEFLACAGKYNEFVSRYCEMYGRAAWFYHTDAPNSMLRAVKESYIDEASVEGGKWECSSVKDLITSKVLTTQQIQQSNIPADAHVIVSNVTNKAGHISKYDEVFIFYSNEEDKDVMWQRSYGFVGNRQNGHLYINAKAELSSVDQTVTKAPTMLAVSQLIDTGIVGVPSNPQLAQNLTKASSRNMTKWSAIQAMVNRTALSHYDKGELKKLPVIQVVKDIKGGEVQLTPEAEAIFRSEVITKTYAGYKEGSKELFYEQLSKALQKVVLDFGPKYPLIWFPAIKAQCERINGDESLTSLVADLFKLLVKSPKATKGKIHPIKQRLAQIKAAIVTLAGSNGLAKSAWQGRKGLNVKAHALLGVPLHEFWYLKGSLVEYIIKQVCRLENVVYDGRVLFTRSPLPFCNMLEGVAIDPTDPRAKLFTVAHVLVNPLVAYINGGDFDGDGYSFIPLDRSESFPRLTYDIVLDTIATRTGKSALGVEQSAYIKDHWFPKTWSGICGFTAGGKLNTTLLKPKNISWFDGEISEENGLLKETRNVFHLENALDNPSSEYYVDKMGASTWLQGIGVGAMHKLASTITNARNIYHREFGKLENVYSGYLTSETDLPAWELYEAGTLGGLSWAAYVVVSLYYSAMTVKDPRFGDTGLKILLENMNKADLNNKNGFDYWTACRHILYKTITFNSFYKITIDKDGKYTAHSNTEDALDFSNLSKEDELILASHLIFNIATNRANFKTYKDGDNSAIVNGYVAAALYLYQNGTCYKAKSITYKMLEKWFALCMPAAFNKGGGKLRNFLAYNGFPHFEAGTTDVTSLIK